MATKSLCSVDGCRKPARTHGMCGTHYIRLWRTGERGGVIIERGKPMEWLLAHVGHTGNECLIWPFQRNNAGYATISQGGKKRSAARIMCRMVHGDPESPDLDTAHSCGNGHEGCINPSHLSWKTRSGNMQDAIMHGTTTRGMKNTQASLTENDVRRIRSMQGSMMYKEIAPLFGVTPSAIGLIMRRERWGWVE